LVVIAFSDKDTRQRRMSSKLRRFELLIPVNFNDGREIPRKWLGEALEEIESQFGALNARQSKVAGDIKAFSIATIFRE
jgi:hypothetical protein